VRSEKKTETCGSCGWSIREDRLLATWRNEFGGETCGDGTHYPSRRPEPAAVAPA